MGRGGLVTCGFIKIFYIVLEEARSQSILNIRWSQVCMKNLKVTYYEAIVI